MLPAAMRYDHHIWRGVRGPDSLTPSEVHVWRLPMDRRAGGRMEETLSPAEKEKADPCFRLCRGFLRILLGRFCGMDPREIRFIKGERGKPRLDPALHRADIEFNVSHSGVVALLALSRGSPLGVDVERIRPAAAMDRIRGRLFSPEEREVIDALPDTERIDAFFACWTRKEAVIKALGGSIVELGAHVAVTAHPREPARILRLPAEPAAGPWLLRDLPAGRGYAAALCRHGRSADVFLWDAGAWLHPGGGPGA